MRSKEAHVLESIANPALPTLQIVEYRGGTTESAPSVTPVSPATSVRSGRYTLRTIPQSVLSAQPALPAAPLCVWQPMGTDSRKTRMHPLSGTPRPRR